MQNFRSESEDYKIIGITGGIGSGKTTAAKYIESKGYPVIYTDNLAKVVTKNDAALKAKLINAFGSDIYDTDGNLDSNKLSKIVFDTYEQDNAKLTLLNQIVHPPTIELMMEQIEELIELGNQLIFVESALIFEAGLDDGFDYIIAIDADEDKRIERTSARLKLSSEEIRKRNSQQISTDIKKKLADFVIENNGNIDQMYNSIDLILTIIKMA